MHAIESAQPKLAALVLANWWTLTTTDLERSALTLLGALPGGWVRQGDNFVRIGNVKYGAEARKLDSELSALSAEAKHILGVGSPESVLRAAAFYHLRFESIHPLCEANGRIGRDILAGQLEQSLKIPAKHTLQGLKDWEHDYHRLFATNNPPVMFELLLDLLSRITGIPISPEAAKLPASIEPLHPQKGVPKNAPRLHPEQALKNPALVKQFAAQSRPPGGGNYYRKFH
jgi:hypothetical protein